MHDGEKLYPELEELSEETLDPNSSYQKIIDLIEPDSRVLDVGCASGYLARLLQRHGCRVVGLDVSAQQAEAAQRYCERVVVADLDVARLSELFAAERFDIVIFADVLEHLRDPWSVLDDARSLLGFSGHAIVSIPNIAHGAIRLALLKGRFDYSEFGILDNTHLRFFTRSTVEELFVQSGFAATTWERTHLPLFVESNLVPAVAEVEFEATTVDTIRSDPEAETLQFVVKAQALDDAGKLAQLAKAYVDARAEASSLAEGAERRENARLRDAISVLENAKSIADEKIAELQAERATYRALQQREAELQLRLDDMARSIENAVGEVTRRVTSMDKVLRHQRDAYDELLQQMASARSMADRARAFASYDLVVERNAQLSAMIEKLRPRPKGFRRLRETALWRFAARVRRRVRRFRASA